MVRIFLYSALFFKDFAFLTEIHHINGEGEDGGAMYSEIKGIENDMHRRTSLTLQRTAFPNCGYGYMVERVLDNIRTSTTIDKVRAYHKQFYSPNNLTLIITGKIAPERVFESLKPIQEKIRIKPKWDTFERPWQTPVERISKSHDIKVSKMEVTVGLG